ncbi:MAG: response regulator [Planctomyces sp.]|nr:response regulator [Planctomyces sp.]
MLLQPQEKIRARYRRKHILNEDEVSCSYIAQDDQGRQVVIHEVKFGTVVSSAVRMRLEYETSRLATLESDRQLAPLEFEFRDTGCSICCPWMTGVTLRDRITARDLTVDEILNIANSILESLTTLHQKGLIRRCIRPSEVFLQGTGAGVRAFLAGFGPLLIVQSQHNSATALEISRYSAPETLGAIEEDLRPAADLYSFGMLLFECLTGRLPFDGLNSGDLVFHHMTSPVPDPVSLNHQIPPSLNELVLRLLQKHPRDRYQSSEGVRYDIRRIQECLRTSVSDRIVLGMMDARESIIEPAFVGRASEMSVIRSEMEGVESGIGRSVVLIAPSGLGKTRLVLEASRLAVARGFLVLRAQGQNQPGLAPLASLQGTLSQCVGIIRQDEELRSRLAVQMIELGRELYAASPELTDALGMAVPESKPEALTDRRIAVALATFLSALGAAGKPVLLLLDDMQWADDLTLIMLECWHLTQSKYSLLLIGMRPSESTSDRLRESLTSAVILTLDPLRREDQDQLLLSMAGELPPQVLDSIWGMAEGNPFVASAVLRGLVEGRVIQPSSSGWSVDRDKLRNVQTSGKAAEVLKQRLFRLPSESRALLAVGAVLGKDFSIEMAADLAGIPQAKVFELLEEPRRNHLVWEQASGRICSFMHDQIRDAVLKSLTRQRRVEIDRRAANYLTQHEPHRVFDIAFHHNASGRPDLAKPFAVEAAERARESHALEAAEQQYRIALRGFFALCEEPEFGVLYGLGDVLMLCGRYQEAEEFFQRALKCAGSRESQAEVTLKLGELAFKEDRKDLAIELWESALAGLGVQLPAPWKLPFSTLKQIGIQVVHSLLPQRYPARKRVSPTTADRLIWRLHSRLAYAYWFVRSKLEVLHTHLRGMNLAECYSPTAELAQAYSEHAPAMSLIPLRRRGIRYGRRSLQIRTAQNDLWGQGQSLHCLAIALYSAAHFEECVDVGRRSVRILEKAGDFWEKHIAQYQVAASLYRLGRFREAAQLAREAYDSGLAVGDYQICGNIIEVWARAANGDVPARILQQELDRPRSDVQGQAHVLLAKGVHAFYEQRYDDAVEAFQQGIDVARKAGISNTYTSPLYAWKATAIRCVLENKSPVTRGPRQALIRQHRRAARMAVLIALRFRNELPHALREYAMAFVFQSCNRRAMWLIQQSVKVAQNQQAEHEVIQSELLLFRVQTELGYSDADKMLELAENRAAAFRNEQLPQRIYSTLSLVDRFDALLESGRRIASGMEPGFIFNCVADAARRLLRSTHSEIILTDDQGQPVTLSEGIRENALAALRSHDAVCASGVSSELRSLLVCPIIVRGRPMSCLVVSNSEVRDLFGVNELRIARYLTAIAGAALENSDGFKSLQELNENLEQIVEERTAAVEARSHELQQTAENLRRVQRQLATAKNSAERASRAKSEFLAQMSHEIRTPIGAVLGFTELLLHGEMPLHSEQRRYLQRVLSNGTHLHRLLNDLLDLSRIEAGQLQIESLTCAPYALFSDILSALQSRAIDKNLTLSMAIVGSVPETITTDPTRLRQILTNLIGNAIKFTSTGGVHLRIETDVLLSRMRIKVRDTGPGIDQAAQKLVFEPFKQADETVNRRFGGTGLGLPISRHLAQALGGDIVLASQPGIGSTFTVTIATGPLQNVRMLSQAEAEQQIADVPSEAHVQADLSDIRILIVDDVEANREFFSLVLQRANADTYFAENGKDALAAVESHQFDLILLDMQMPVMDGYQAAEALRKQGITIPILAITANGTDDDKSRCREAGCSGYLTKPITISELLRGVAEAVGRTIQQLPQTAAATHESLGTDAVDAEDGSTDDSRSPSLNNIRAAVRKSSVALPSDPMFRDVAVRFVAKIEAAYPEITKVIADNNGRRLCELAHWIKGTGGTVGLQGLTDLGEALHSAGKSEDFASAKILLMELGQVIEALRREAEMIRG